MRRGALIVPVLICAAIVLLVFGGRRFLFESQQELVLEQVLGEVTVVLDSEPVSPPSGYVLKGRERLSTGANSQAVLTFGSETRIRIGESADLEVVSVSSDGVAIELEDGSVQATVRPTASPLRIGNGTRQVQATDAEFSVAVDDDLFFVESQRGDLMLQGVSETATLREGQRLVLDPAKPETLPIPADLLLDVQWPTDMRTRAAQTEVRGTTAPGAKVHVTSTTQSTSVQADLRGSFVAVLPIAEGQNDVRVRAVDLFGKTIEVTGIVVRDTQGPVFRGGVQ